MQIRSMILGGLMLLVPATFAFGQKDRDAEFLKAKPALGEAIPELTIYSPNGKEVKTSSLKGQFVVLTFGCLT